MKILKPLLYSTECFNSENFAAFRGLDSHLRTFHPSFFTVQTKEQSESETMTSVNVTQKSKVYIGIEGLLVQLFYITFILRVCFTGVRL